MYDKGRKVRRALLDAAIEVFAAQGYGGASVAELAGRAGCSKNQLFHYFGCKEDLCVEAARAATGDFNLRVASATAAVADPLLRLDWVIELVRRLEQRGWAGARLLALFSLTASGLPVRPREEARTAIGLIHGFVDGLAYRACAQDPGLPEPAVLSRTVTALIFAGSWTAGAADGAEGKPLLALLGRGDTGRTRS